ncbi:hypothetical protein [Vibrio nigripulchritudo]|uniref:hypothetical protein n=1 Tax=Vibrio nigripulchritudo TaxID=28173 RepID=UPI0024911FEE|nr:hypothetical protein [Vibrio nigripulchritudo]BDU37150.1 hypothetical protein TUMSATVNIG2_16190 [Vibrio nigripulchritudo]BDU42862.1 hypothetical protein TUMSATVNIG3_16600 [Vibrio nigripulchritudo]
MSTVSCPRISDSRLVKIFVDEVLSNYEKFGFNNTLRVIIDISSNTYICTILNTESGEHLHIPDIIQRIKDESISTSSIQRIYIHDKNIRNHRFSYNRSSESLIDSIELPTGEVPEDIVLSHLKIQEILFSCESINSNDFNYESMLSLHHEVLSKLENHTANLIDKQVERNTKIEKEREEFIAAQTEEFDNKAETLESSYRAKLEQLETEYNNRKLELDERQKLIEDSDNTTARRKTTTSMLDEVKEKAKNFNFSQSVQRYSNGTFIFAAFLMIIAIWNTISSISEIRQLLHITTPTETPTEIGGGVSTYMWFLYTRIFLGSALLVSSLIYIIKWFNTWANRLAQQELENQQFVRDLNRAHLAVEMCLEWDQQKDGEIPNQLLNSITEGLFKDKSNTISDVSHPADQLASALVRSADKIKVPFGTGEFEVSGSKISKAKTPKAANNAETTNV